MLKGSRRTSTTPSATQLPTPRHPKMCVSAAMGRPGTEEIKSGSVDWSRPMVGCRLFHRNGSASLRPRHRFAFSSHQDHHPGAGQSRNNQRGPRKKISIHSVCTPFDSAPDGSKCCGFFNAKLCVALSYPAAEPW